MDKEKTLSFRIAIDGVSAEGEELAKLQYQLKNLNAEKRELMKLQEKEGFLSNENKAKLAAYNKEIKEQETRQKELKKVVDTADDSLARMRAELIKLKDQYVSVSAAERQQLAPAIVDLNNKVMESERAIGVHQRNVGNYPTLMGSVTQNFNNFGASVADNIRGLASFSGIAAAVTIVVGKLKDAILSTTTGMDLMNQATQISKQLFYDLSTTMSINIENIKEANRMAQEMNKIRQGDLIDMVIIKDLESDIKDLRLLSVDATLSLADQQMYLNQAIEKEDELIKFKVADLKEELDVIEQGLKMRPDDYKLQLAFVTKLAELREVQSEKSLRLASKESETRKKAQAEEEKRAANMAAYIAEIEAAVKATDELNDQQDELITKIVGYAQAIDMAYKAPGVGDIPAEIAEAEFIRQEEERIWAESMAAARENSAAQKREAKETLDGIHAIDLDALDRKQEISNAMGDIAYGLSETLKDAAGKNKALALLALSVDKGSAIAQIIYNAGIANAKARAFSPMTLGQPWVGINTGLTAISIARIVAESVKGAQEISRYEGGGRITHGIHVNTGTVDDTLILANKYETVLNQRQIAALGGSRMMKRIGVPGYAEGGYIGQLAPEIPAMGFDIQALARLINSQQIVLDINKVNSAQREVAIIAESQPI